MDVYAIYGRSGTGKSTSALNFAHEHHIEAIIDDGLLIKDGKRIAGLSAKFEKNALTAVKRAIFADEQHYIETVNALKDEQIQSLLILGTSKKMTEKIAERLRISPILHFIPIEEIRTKEEISLARYVREMHGTHTMPLPQSEVAQNFFKRLIRKGKDIISSKKEKIGETTIVSPDFHTPSIFIDGKVYEQVLSVVTTQLTIVTAVHKVKFQFTEHLPEVFVEISILAPVTYDVRKELMNVQAHIQAAFLTTFELQLSSIRIAVKGIIK